MVVKPGPLPYLEAMTATPAFLDANRPDVPDIVVARGITRSICLAGRCGGGWCGSVPWPTPC